MGYNLTSLTAEVHDNWRKVIHPSLIASKPWSTGNGGSWTSAEKIKVVMLVIKLGDNEDALTAGD